MPSRPYATPLLHPAALAPLVVCGGLLTTAPAPAQTRPAAPRAAQQEAQVPATDTTELKRRLGETVTVVGTVSEAAWSRTGKVMNIEFAGAGDGGLLVVLFDRQREAFDKAFTGDFGKALTGAEVRIRGRLEEYGGRDEAFMGRPQIILRGTEQVTIIKPAGGQ